MGSKRVDILQASLRQQQSNLKYVHNKMSN